MSNSTLLEKCCLLADTVVGDPTHFMIEQAFEQAELDWRFMSFEIEEDQLAPALTGLDVLGFRGVKLANGFRLPAAGLVPKLTSRARRAGSVSCLVRQDDQLVGDDLFGDAFVEAVDEVHKLVDAHLLVIGSGRTARSIAAAASSAGAVSIHLADDDEAALEELAAELSAESSTCEFTPLGIENNTVYVPGGVAIVAFAPATGDEIPRPMIDAEGVGQQLVLVDTRLSSSRTGLLRFAAQQGAVVIEGVELMARETALTLEAWTSLEFHRAPLREMAEEYLGV